VEQVKQMKPPRDVIDPSNVQGYDPLGRDFATSEDARQDLAWESGYNREAMKRIAKQVPLEYPGSPIRHEELSSEDENFNFDSSHVEEAVKDPSKLPLLYSSFENPKPRPAKWKYTKKKRKALGAPSDEPDPRKKKKTE
jgi:hypothetical protein